MVPHHARIGAGDHDTLTFVAHCPNLRRVDPLNVPLRSTGSRNSGNYNYWLLHYRERTAWDGTTTQLHPRICLDALDFVSPGNLIDLVPARGDFNHVHGVKRLEGNAAVLQHFSERGL